MGEAAGFGLWQTRPSPGEWQECPADVARQLEFAYSTARRSECTFTLTREGLGMRKGDPETLQYKVDFETWTQHCVEFPSRTRQVRRVGRQEQDMTLTKSQKIAIAHAEQMAFENGGDSMRNLRIRLNRLSGGDDLLRETDMWMRFNCPIIIHTCLQTGDLIDKYLQDEDGFYRNLFEVGAGRGALDKGFRKGWERKFFGAAYEHHSVEPVHRPKYGCLNLTNHPKGVPRATQYGTSYFQLKDTVRWRCTITSRDSSMPDSRPGTFRQYARFMEEGETSRLTDDELLKVARHNGQDIIEFYKEVQIHGLVRFGQDIEKLVADIRLSSATKRKVSTFAHKHGFPVEFREMHDFGTFGGAL